MTHWSDIAAECLEREGRAVLVTVAAAYGSAPREAGAKMIVSRESFTGTIGGGALEYTATARARELLDGQSGAPELVDYSLGPKLDQCCGGSVSLLFEPLCEADREWLEAARAAARNRSEARRLVDLTGGSKPCLVAKSSGEDGLEAGESLALLASNGQRHQTPRVYTADVAAIIEAVHPPRPQLFMFGAGHVGRAVAHIIGTLDFDVTWVDPRPDAFPEQVPSNIATAVEERPAERVAQAPAGAFYLVFTHSHPLDFEITAAVLARGDARYCGLIGSETKRVRFVKRFRDELGLSEEQIGRLTCPIGMGGPPGKAPEVIAVGVAEELLTVEQGGRP